LILPNTTIDTAGVFGFIVTAVAKGAQPWVGVVKVVANEEVDTYGRLGAPAGASVSADVAAVKADTASLLTNVAAAPAAVWAALLGGGSRTITGTGARVVDGSGNAVAPAATALTNATWTDARAGKIDDLDATVSSRAAAATAVSSADLTPTRAAALDNLDAAV